jgi:hypothetical protein
MENVSASVSEEALCARFADGFQAQIPAHHIARSSVLQEAMSNAPCDRPFILEVPQGYLQAWLQAATATDLRRRSTANSVLALQVRERSCSLLQACLRLVENVRAYSTCSATRNSDA